MEQPYVECGVGTEAADVLIHFHIHGSVHRDYINKIQRDSTVSRCLFTAKVLYMWIGTMIDSFHSPGSSSLFQTAMISL